MAVNVYRPMFSGQPQVVHHGNCVGVYEQQVAGHYVSALPAVLAFLLTSENR